ncbi:MAG: hypothetical protein KAI53_05850 [Candidatus Aenigmarchaeota archaeon]|nr:hypothetical protein [Candidatus Aenigmarchaeota archaeon]
MFEKVLFEIQSAMKIHSFIEGYKRIDIPEYPPEAIREAVVNAIVHRDYFERNTEIFIKIFTDRLEISNPANFPFQNTTFEEIKQMQLSKRRNQLIADAFEQVKMMEKEGRGLTTLGEMMNKHGLPAPIFEVGTQTFKIVLRNASENPNILQKSPFKNTVDFEGLNARQQQLINHMSKNEEPISRNEYMALSTITEKTATRDLQDLVKRTILVKQGQKRGTTYLLSVDVS